MNDKIISEIKIQMKTILSDIQMLQLEKVLEQIKIDQQNNTEQEKVKKNVINHFINAKEIEGCSQRTILYYKKTLLHFEKTIQKNLTSANSNDIREYLINYQKKNKCTNVTLDTIRRILSSFYQWLEDEDFILKSPMKRIHRIKAPVIIKPALSEEEIEIIRKEASNSTRNLAIVDFLISSGIRISELVNLNRSSVNLNNRTCIVLGKGNKQRETYFDVRTKIELETYLKSRKDKNKALFITSRKKNQNGNYSRLKINSIEKMIREIGIKTEIENVHPHRFRRTLATRAIDKGMPIEQVQVLLGHAKIDTTMKYANVEQANVRYSHQKYIS